MDDRPFMGKLIQLHALSYTYPNREAPALDHVDLAIDAGEFVLVAGPSGSGKSTLLRIFNGLVPHFSGGKISGAAYVKGHETVAAGPQILSRHVGFVSQNPEAQTVLEKVEPEIAFALENAAIPRPEMHERVGEVLERLNLTALRDRSISTLSGGERQRVAIASALALRPEILVLDEPTSQLDPASAADVLHILRELNQTMGLTIVLAEHRLERVLAYADSLVYVEYGRIAAAGDVGAVIGHISCPPPMIELAGRLKWDPLPLTMDEARRRAAQYSKLLPPQPAPATSASGERERPAALLQVQDLSFAYNRETQALAGVNFDLKAGEIVAVMGANGSGKSTLLRCLVGLLQPSAGDVQLNGRSTRGKSTVELARQIAYLPQYPDDLLYAETVAEELAITLDNHDIAAENRVQTMIENLTLQGLANYYPRDLSTGQRQRVALGAITITQPQILLLDEPTRGQDGQVKQQLVEIWREWKAQGMGIILVTHDVELVALLADRVLILSAGKIEAVGPVHQVLGASPEFAPEIVRLFPGRGWITVNEALNTLSGANIEDTEQPA